EDANGHVGAVEAREGKEGRTEQVSAERQTIPVESRELIELTAEKDAAEQCRRRQPDPHSVFLTTLDGREGQHHGQAAEEEDEGADRRVWHVECLAGERTVKTAVLVDHVRRDQRAEKHTVGRE